MRVSYRWLGEYVDIADISPQELAERLTRAGIEVESVTPRNQGVAGVVVSHVLKVMPHPNADRLRVCEVDVGSGAPLCIVCGAPNVAPGQKVPTALPGARLPGGRIDRAKLRGVESHGMLCSAKEIGLETRLLPREQTEGLYILPDDAPVGADVVAYLGLDDVVLELSLTPNRADCLSMRGLAYEVAALLGRPHRFPDADGGAAAAGNDGAAAVTVRIETDLCPRYEAQVLAGVRPGPSPVWMQARLLAAGIRPINVIVDVTNYVMLEWGQPLHAFDLDQVRGRTIVVRQARPGERIVTLDGVERELGPETIVIADAERAIGIAGVMGGENSEVSAATTRIVLESAAFDAASVRRTGQRLGLRSEAQQRFEKGIDPVAVRGALVRATELLVTLAGAQPEGPLVSAQRGAATPQETKVTFAPARCNRLLGTEIPPATMAEVFARLGFAVEGTDGDEWTVRVPSRRRDVALEADLIEEVGRLCGYDTIPATLPVGPTTVGQRTLAQRLRTRTRAALVASGMTEVFTYSLTSPQWFDAMRLPADSPLRRAIPLLRPMSEERVVLRTHLLPGLAQVAAYNLAHGVPGGQVFEIGRVYWPHELPLVRQPEEPTQWAGLWFGEAAAGFGERPRRYDFFDAKGAIERWLQAIGLLDEAAFRPGERPYLHPGRTAEVWIQDCAVGVVGELHPETAARWELAGAVYAEFHLDAVTPLVQERWRVAPLPKHPAVRRDLAVLVARAVHAGDLLRLAQAACAGSGLLEDAFIFDVYEGQGIPAGEKSVAMGFVFRAPDRTLTDAEVDAEVARILARLAEDAGARLRQAGF
ncbi:phenylalanine--tRNA ligase beta subunit [Alicyclobacillus cellulosilyticus]|uniref:Phenylalanine--tRNA ligase beta subunit n=1 Tax=Alicyclobacillus cellulosilyticus TaxID=1003997 RepID=A0A917KC38_9BACL|nr:phenylalanine--tRNA ligase subunit beta [Alicyclobacillus cellulosilyticus]GGJ06309.1 phenylalanine--tRNA ligase beta subunit [Alicyclobacillus cellulosilyticus]